MIWEGWEDKGWKKEDDWVMRDGEEDSKSFIFF